MNEQGKVIVIYINICFLIELGVRLDIVEVSLENGSFMFSILINVNVDVFMVYFILLQVFFDIVFVGDIINLYIEVKDNYGNGVFQQEVIFSVLLSEGVIFSNNVIYMINYDGNFYVSFIVIKVGVY